MLKKASGGSMDKRKSVTRATFDTSSSTEASTKRAVRVGGFAILAGATIALAFFGLAPSVGAADDAAGAQTYKSNCVVCHGADGTGTPTGKSLMAPDLHSDAVQKMTVAQMTTQVSDGKNNMPPFKSTLSEDQIKDVVAYVRTTFGKKK
jgi:mono/diheme cytochrome c family protein